MTRSITIDKAILADLSRIGSLTSGAISVPIIRFVLITVEADGAHLSTSNGQCYRRVPTTSVTSKEPIIFCVEYDKLFSIISLHGTVECEITYDKHPQFKSEVIPIKMVLTGSRGRASLPLESGTEFLVTPDHTKYQKAVVISSHLFKMGIDKARKFTTPGTYGEDTDCVSIGSRGNQLLVMGTDRSNVYMASITAAFEPDQHLNFLLSDVIYSKLLPFLPDADVEISLHINPGRSAIFFFGEGDWLSFSLSEGNTRMDMALQLIKATYPPVKIMVERKSMLDVFKHLSDLVLTKDMNTVSIRVEGSGLNISAVDSMGQYTTSVFIEADLGNLEKTIDLLIDGSKFQKACSILGEVIVLEVDYKPGTPMKMTDRDDARECKEVVISAQKEG